MSSHRRGAFADSGSYSAPYVWAAGSPAPCTKRDSGRGIRTVDPVRARGMYAVQRPVAASAFEDVMGGSAWKPADTETGRVQVALAGHRSELAGGPLGPFG
jgi:hypothetical protein